MVEEEERGRRVCWMLARRQMLRQLTSEREIHILTDWDVREPDEMETFIHLYLHLIDLGSLAKM
ncbi:hypothetical protein E3U43_019576 [Larimichthys crocea]|uniref:Uncharacterized protein n=1 Tax=Larimichthys crocea TaxID=215358 RepID=A0ACD3QVT0_LARCR|nr:hypothetical protein E3U43_019576 [Larimichthys crocea]